MTWIDVFNGDADGLCALHQLRLSDPRDSVLITGVKRDTALVARAEVTTGDHLTVLDVSLEQNRAALLQALDAGASCFYVDHHFPGEIPHHPGLQSLIRTEATTCTSLLVDEHLGGAHVLWALVAAFGDGLGAVAQPRCRALGLSDQDVTLLKELGESINYNAYGEVLADLHYPPAELYRLMQPHADPREFVGASGAYRKLRQAYGDDLAHALATPALLSTVTHFAVRLPDAAWSRRVNGALAHHLADSQPRRAHAILVPRARGFLVSVRAPRQHPQGADALCRQFATGGGRAGAGGINLLPVDDLARFLTAFEAAFQQPAI